MTEHLREDEKDKDEEEKGQAKKDPASPLIPGGTITPDSAKRVFHALDHAVLQRWTKQAKPRSRS